MNLPPLPIVDGHLFIDNSFIEKLNQCPRSVEYSYLHRRKPVDAQPALNFGAAIHAALAYRYVNCPDSISATHNANQHNVIENWFAEKPNPVDSHRNSELAHELIRGYNKKWMIEEFSVVYLNEKPAVELPFAVPLYTNAKHNVSIIYCGRIDLIVSADGLLYTLDHKTTSIMGEGFFKFYSVSPQMLGYVWGAQKATGNTFGGFIINAIRVPRPTKKDGIVVKPDDFERLKVYISQDEVDEWFFNTKFLIDEFLDQYYRGFLPQRKTWCVHKYGTCEYFDVCSLTKETRLMQLQSGAYQDDEWSPLDNFHKIRREPNT